MRTRNKIIVDFFAEVRLPCISYRIKILIDQHKFKCSEFILFCNKVMGSMSTGYITIQGVIFYVPVSGHGLLYPTYELKTKSFVLIDCKCPLPPVKISKLSVNRFKFSSVNFFRR